MSNLGKLNTVPLREIWPDEARDFTPWLANNMDALGAALGFDLELKETEAAVGDFSLDLFAVDVSSRRNVVIENQLTPTDHAHLGKLITYASGFNASIIIWIAQTIRDEHRQALEWLNQRTDTETQFFAVVVEVLQIDDSKPACNFKPTVFPNEWQKSKAGTYPKNNLTSRQKEYLNYFQPLIDELKEKYRFTNVKKAQPQNWQAFSSGISGVLYSVLMAQGSVPAIHVYIDFGKGKKERNKRLFDALEAHKNDIHDSYGSHFEWNRLDEKRACVIQLGRDDQAKFFQMSDDEKYEARKWQIDHLLKMKQVFTPFLKQTLKTKNIGLSKPQKLRSNDCS